MTRARLPLALATLLALAACSTTPSQCVVRSLGQLPTSGSMPFIPVLVQNRMTTLLVDTGTPRSVLSASIVTASAVVTHQSDITAVGIGGRSNTIATIPTLTVGYATAHDVDFYSAPLTGRGPDGTPLNGLFGGDFLANYDVLIDLPAHRVGLYNAEGCSAASFAPLGPGVPSMPFGAPGRDIRHDTRILFQAQLDGVAMPFILDSGAGISLVSIPWAVRAGLRAPAMRNDPPLVLGGLGIGLGRLHPFKSFQLPIEIPVSPVLGVYTGTLNVLGDDFLSRNRVWISYPLRRLYVQPVAQ